MKGTDNMKCEECGSEMKEAIATAATGGLLYVSDTKKNMIGIHKNSKVNCFCCPECGYIELYAVDPTIFKER